MKMEIKYINYGTGNRVGDVIYLNRELKKYPRLHDAVLNHEKKHTGRFSVSDLTLDFANDDLMKVKGEWNRFILKHPKSWINFLPVIRLGSNWCVDVALTSIWIITIAILILIFKGLAIYI